MQILAIPPGIAAVCALPRPKIHRFYLSHQASNTTLGGCRTLGVESENAPQRNQFLPDSQPHSGAMRQEAGKKWAAAAHSQPTIPKSDSLLR
ncbi:hypothetical protein FUT63_10625 [Extensimonas vulgaris]|nr:hypothetical protein FUT63_10625 [Extensimonas vulgaris]